MLFITKLRGKIEIAAASAIRIAIEIPFLFEGETRARLYNWKIGRNVSTVPFSGKTQNDKMISREFHPRKTLRPSSAVRLAAFVMRCTNKYVTSLPVGQFIAFTGRVRKKK